MAIAASQGASPTSAGGAAAEATELRRRRDLRSSGHSFARLKARLDVCHFAGRPARPNADRQGRG